MKPILAFLQITHFRKVLCHLTRNLSVLQLFKDIAYFFCAHASVNYWSIFCIKIVILFYLKYHFIPCIPRTVHCLSQTHLSKRPRLICLDVFLFCLGFFFFQNLKIFCDKQNLNLSSKFSYFKHMSRPLLNSYLYSYTNDVPWLLIHVLRWPNF